MEEMRATGVPMIRYMMLEFDDTSLDIDDQFMLGSKYMMAPVFAKGVTSRKVFFPQGTWKHYFTEELVQVDNAKGLTRAVACPTGQPAVFIRLGVDSPI